MEFTVDITLHAKRPLTVRALFDLAEIGGVAVGNPGDRRVETTMTVEADDMRQAAERAIERVSECVPGTVLAVEAMTTAEADRRLC